jgi:hypothetical protein
VHEDEEEDEDEDGEEEEDDCFYDTETFDHAIEAVLGSEHLQAAAAAAAAAAATATVTATAAAGAGAGAGAAGGGSGGGAGGAATGGRSPLPATTAGNHLVVAGPSGSAQGTASAGGEQAVARVGQIRAGGVGALDRLIALAAEVRTYDKEKNRDYILKTGRDKGTVAEKSAGGFATQAKYDAGVSHIHARGYAEITDRFIRHTINGPVYKGIKRRTPATILSFNGISEQNRKELQGAVDGGIREALRRPDVGAEFAVVITGLTFNTKKKEFESPEAHFFEATGRASGGAAGACDSASAGAGASAGADEAATRAGRQWKPMAMVVGAGGDGAETQAASVGSKFLTLYLFAKAKEKISLHVLMGAGHSMSRERLEVCLDENGTSGYRVKEESSEREIDTLWLYDKKKGDNSLVNQEELIVKLNTIREMF